MVKVRLLEKEGDLVMVGPTVEMEQSEAVAGVKSDICVVVGCSRGEIPKEWETSKPKPKKKAKEEPKEEEEIAEDA